MPGLYKDEAIVLKTIKLGEADRIVTLFTRFNGKVRAVAKGIRRTKSRFGARLEPFTRVDLMIYRGRGELDTITSADIITAFDGVRRDYQRLTAGASLLELVDKITPDRERATPAYRLLVAGLEAIAADLGPSVVPAFMVKLLSLSGYHPQLEVCSGCGTAAGLTAFSSALGGALCDSCRFEDNSAVEMDSDRISTLALLLASDFGDHASFESARELTMALRGYAEYHLERPLRSLTLEATS